MILSLGKRDQDTLPGQGCISGEGKGHKQPGGFLPPGRYPIGSTSLRAV